MKVKLLVSRAGADVSNAPGEIIDIDPAEAKRLLESNQAEPVAEKRAEKAEKRPSGKATESR